MLLTVALSISAGAQPAPRSVAGTWMFEVVTENGTGTPTVILKQDGNAITGTYESARSGLRQIVGTLKADTIAFTAKSSTPEGVDLHFRGVIMGDTITGTADFSGQGSATFSAKRRP
jgi:hypothetical protein